MLTAAGGQAALPEEAEEIRDEARVLEQNAPRLWIPGACALARKEGEPVVRVPGLGEQDVVEQGQLESQEQAGGEQQIDSRRELLEPGAGASGRRGGVRL